MILNYASLGNGATAVEYGNLGITYDSSTNIVEITGVDTNEPIIVESYLNTAGNTTPNSAFSNITIDSQWNRGTSSEGSQIRVVIGHSTNGTVKVKFENLQSTLTYLVTAYQVTQ